MSRTSFSLSILSFVLASGAAIGQERTPLLHDNLWEVDLVVDDETGYRSCRASKIVKSGDVFGFGVGEDGNEILILALWESYWHEEFIGDLILRIDDEEWTLEGASFYALNTGISAVSFEFPEGNAFQSFTSDLNGASSVALMDENGQESLFTWSLEGSSAALSKLGDCYGTISDVNYSPRLESKNQLNSSRG